MVTPKADCGNAIDAGEPVPKTSVPLPIAGAELKDTVGLGVSDDEIDFAARFGAGIDVYLTKNTTATVAASYVFPTGDLKDLDYVSVNAGLQYRF